jgi:magnesium chelatase subunit I
LKKRLLGFKITFIKTSSLPSRMQKLLQKIFLEKDPFDDIIGQDKVKKNLKSALLVGRNVIIIGPPGIGKTTLAKNVSKLLPEMEVMNCDFHCSPNDPLCPSCRAGKTKDKKKLRGDERFIRIQGSPDLTAEDLLGDIDPIKALQFGPLSLEAFTPGKIFKANNGVLFFDELNRCPEKLQNSMLQILEEKKATLASYDVSFPGNFIFIGTMNPEDASTEVLSEVFLDRFDMIYMEYPETLPIEKRIVLEKGEKLDIEFPETLLEFSLNFVRLLRNSEKLSKKPSVRASLGIYERAQANAFLREKKRVDAHDVEDVLVSVLTHRIELKPSFKYMESPQSVIQEEFKKYQRSAASREKENSSSGDGP